ncbi:MAG: hypothetical protein R6U52_03505 [Kosmotogaceae bacterium]
MDADERKTKNLTLVSTKYKKRANKRLTRLDKKSVSAKIALVVLLCVILPAFGYFVLFYAYTGLTSVESLTREIDELESVFKQVQQFKKIYNDSIDKLANMSRLNEIAARYDLPSDLGNHNNISYREEPEEMLGLINALFTDPRVKVDSLELRSNLGFPVLPETRLESGVMLELNVDYTITKLIR